MCAVPVSAGMIVAVPAELLASPLKSGRNLGDADRSALGVAGMARLHELIGEQPGEDADDAEVIIGTETDRGPWVAALVAAGYTVYGVNPLQASRYRERHGVSGAKSDRGDAHMLTDMVRTDSRQLRAVAGDSPGAEAVKVVARTHKTLIWERTRQAPAAAAPAAGVLPRRAGWPSMTWTRPMRWSCWPGHRTRRRPRS